MRIAPLGIIFFLSFFSAQSQVIYVSSSTNAIYRLNMDDCTYAFVTQVNRQIYDIGFHPDGSLYGISGNGNFFAIDTLTGQTSLIHDFGGQTFNSLTLGSDALVYTIGNDGELWTYNLQTGVETYLGDIGYDATGDLTFYKGRLYVAVTGDRIVLINLNMVQNSSVVINDDISGNILGIVSDVVDCTEINCYAISNGMSDIYQINFETNSLELVCELTITVGGGASTSEFLASSPLVIDTTMLIQPDCDNQNGEAVILANGGSGAYSYALNGGIFQSSNDFTSLSQGNHTAIVHDQLGCEDTTTFLLLPPAIPVIDTVLALPGTCGENNGTLTVLASGGAGNYTYSLNGGQLQSSNMYLSLSAGIYNIMVVDQAGCSDSVEWVLSMNDAPVIQDLIIENNTCGLNNGSIMTIASGGSGTLMYSMDNFQYQASPLFTNLGSGPYTVFVMDSTGCLANEMAQLDSIASVSIVDVDYTNPSCGGVFTGSVQIMTNSTDDIQYSLDGIQFQTDDSFGNLAEGTYLLTVQDANGCRDTMTLSLWMNSSPQITNVTMTPERCSMEDGSLTVTSNGGTGMHQYALNGGNFQESNTFTNLPAGIYDIEIRDESGCSFTTKANVEAFEGFTITDIATIPALCEDNSGRLAIKIEGGISPVLFSLDNVLTQEEGTFINLAAGIYQIRINDAAGCSKDTLVAISRSGCPVYIPNVFSPNGDGINDLFQIRVNEVEQINITRFFIFDRWGNMVYERFNLPAQSGEGWWDGTYKRFTSSPGVYAYYLEVEFTNGERKTYKGDVTLIR